MDVEDSITCPITGLIFLYPVIAFDGFTYEEDAILKWFADHNTSPMTNLALEHTNLCPDRKIQKIVQEHLKINPNDKENQYVRPVQQPSPQSQVSMQSIHQIISARQW